MLDAEEPQPRGALEEQSQLGLGHTQALAGADEDRHAGPAPVVDLQAKRRVGLGAGVRRDSLDLAIAVVLPAHVMSRTRVRGGAEDGELGVLHRFRVRAGGRLHRRRREQLHEMVHDHVAQGADRVVEMPAILDPKALGHRDLHAREVVSVPHRLEHRVGEAQVQDLFEAHLAEEVVDPIQLRLLHEPVQFSGQRARGGDIVAERLLHHDPGALAEQLRACEALHDRREQRRRYLQVEDGGVGLAIYRSYSRDGGIQIARENRIAQRAD